MITRNPRATTVFKAALRAFEGVADDTRFRAVPPFYLVSPYRTRESVARVFIGGFLPTELLAVIANEIDALLIVFAFEIRMWARSLLQPASKVIEAWRTRLPRHTAVQLTQGFWRALRFLAQPDRAAKSALSKSVSISYPEDRFFMRSRAELDVMAELVETAERLALFTDEPRLEERDDEAGDLRRALRRNVQLSQGSAERCTVRLPSLTHRQYQDALENLFNSRFLPVEDVGTAAGAAARSRWWQLVVGKISVEATDTRPPSLVDRLKRAAREQFADFVALNALSSARPVFLSTSAELAQFLESDKPGLILLGAGGSGKSTLIRQLSEISAEIHRTVLVYPLRNRRLGNSLDDLIRSTLAATSSQQVDFSEIAQAFAARQEELVIVLEGLNEIGDPQAVMNLYQSFVEAAIGLADRAPRAGLRLILTSRPEAYFRISSRLGLDPPPKAFGLLRQAEMREPRPYLEIPPLTPSDREKLFASYLADSREDGAEHEMTRIVRRDRTFAALLSKPIMIALAGDLYRRGVPIATMRSAADLVDLMVEHGFTALRDRRRADQAWRTLGRIFERRLQTGDVDVVKFEDVWIGATDSEEIVTAALVDLSDMGFLQPYLDQSQALVSFAHERIEENLLTRYLDRLDAMSPSDAVISSDQATKTCLALSEGKTLYEEALTGHLKGAISDFLSDEQHGTSLLWRRWQRLLLASRTLPASQGLARILARAVLNLALGGRARELGERWLSRAVKGFVSPTVFPGAIAAVYPVLEQLVEGFEALLDAQVGGLAAVAEEIRSAVRGHTDDQWLEARCVLIVARCDLADEKWSAALGTIDRFEMPAVASREERVVCELLLAKGIALRNLGRTREATTAMQAALRSQRDRGDHEGAARTLPSLLEALREYGDFRGGLKLLDDAQERNTAAPRRQRLLTAMWRGILNKNLMQDAILFQWNADTAVFEVARDEAVAFRNLAMQALEKAQDIAATDDRDDRLLPDLVQVLSELAETALSFAIADPECLKEADRRIDELGKFLALQPSLEPNIEYHRYRAQRAALGADFATARSCLQSARDLAVRNGMAFLETDCDLDWARFVARAPACFSRTDIRQAIARLQQAVRYYEREIGPSTYYARMAERLLNALNHALASPRRTVSASRRSQAGRAPV